MSDIEYRHNAFLLVTGSANARALPEMNAYWARIKVPATGILGYIGTNGVANYPLDAGNDTGWFPLNDVSEIYVRGTGTFSVWYEY